MERTMNTLLLEIHAASGGADAADFAATLSTAYLRAAARGGWRAAVAEGGTSDARPKRIVIAFSGPGVDILAGEAGGHRVIRMARDNVRHTSIVTVAVLPAPGNPDEPIERSELRIEAMRASGHGGQNVNKRDTAVRVTHLPTGLQARIADERYQGRNKAAAVELVSTRLRAHRAKIRAAQTDLARANQLGSGEFAQRRRTYAVREGTVLDHLSGRVARLSAVLAGDFSELWGDAQ
jgi:peptide chain release factor 1